MYKIRNAERESATAELKSLTDTFKIEVCKYIFYNYRKYVSLFGLYMISVIISSVIHIYRISSHTVNR